MEVNWFSRMRRNSKYISETWKSRRKLKRNSNRIPSVKSQDWLNTNPLQVSKPLQRDIRLKKVQKFTVKAKSHGSSEDWKEKEIKGLIAEISKVEEAPTVTINVKIKTKDSVGVENTGIVAHTTTVATIMEILVIANTKNTNQGQLIKVTNEGPAVGRLYLIISIPIKLSVKLSSIIIYSVTETTLLPNHPTPFITSTYFSQLLFKLEIISHISVINLTLNCLHHHLSLFKLYTIHIYP